MATNETKQEFEFGMATPRPGEVEAIRTIRALGAQYGYGNLISRLRDAWSEHLQDPNSISKFDKDTADRAAGHVCAWCQVDTRTGKKVKLPKGKAPR